MNNNDTDMHKKVMKTFRRRGVTDIIPLAASRIRISDWVIMKCRFGCDSYNTNHACSPATIPVSDFKKIIGEYSQALLIVGEGEGITNQNRFIEILTELEREYFLKGYYKAFALTNGPCKRCKECSYPNNCRMPRVVRPALESVGIDMFATIKDIGREMKVLIDEEKFNCYGLILLE